MPFRSMIFPQPPTTLVSAGLLVLRGFAGIAMATHGWGKVQNPFHWLDMSENPPPAVLQMLAAVAEFGGGLGLAVGLLSVIASFGIGCTMLVAIQFHLSKGDPFDKWEKAALYLCIAVMVLLAGPGRFSIDAFIAQKPRQ